MGHIELSVIIYRDFCGDSPPVCVCVKLTSQESKPAPIPDNGGGDKKRLAIHSVVPGGRRSHSS